MKFILLILLFIQTLTGFEVKGVKNDFYDGKYHLHFKIDEKSKLTIECEDENISLTLEKGRYNIALECRAVNIAFDKKQRTKTYDKNTTLNIIYPKDQNISYFKVSKPLKAIKVPKNISFDNIIDEIENKKVIFVGESHNKMAHHLNQLKVIRSLYERGKKVAIGMEMFQREFQPFIDEYLNGKIDLKTFLKKSKYKKRWGFDYNLYKPIIDFAKRHHIPVIALNLEREITKKISKNGLFSLSKEDQKKLPGTIDLSNREYKDDLIKFFSSHQHMKKSKNKKLEYIYQAQILWDQTMAESINNYLKEHPNYQMVVIAGSGHLKMRYGIPDHVIYSQAVILQDEEAEPKSADFILYSDDIELQSSK
jgi:uncharacterized iron-regulated protein